MFGLVDMIDNALTVGGNLLAGELPSQREVAKLIADGIEIAAIAAFFDVSVDVIQEMLDG